MHTTRIQNQNQNATTKEGNIEGRPAIKHRRKKKQTTEEKKQDTNVPYKNNQTTLDNFTKEHQITLFDFC